MIIEEHKTIFIHIPKNAGTSIETLFANSSFRIQPNKHANIHEIKKKFPKLYDSHRKFTIVRNPYDKMVSWYFYLKRKVGEKHKVVEFNDWIKDPQLFWHADDPIHFLDPQHTWIDDTVKVIKFENLNEELNEFFKEDIKLPITNKSNHDHYSTYYNRKSLDIIYDRYEEDFEKFNYKKL
jgi:hypothetical protein